MAMKLLEELEKIRKQGKLVDALKREQKNILDDLTVVTLLIAQDEQQELLNALRAYQLSVIKEWMTLIALKEQGKEIIERLPDPQERAILYNRYINNMSWNKIADAMCYSWSGLFRLRGRALKHLQDAYRSTPKACDIKKKDEKRA